MSTQPVVSEGPFRGATGLLRHVGNTPILELSEALHGLIPAGVRVVGKAEWFNPGGSVKDRPALSIVLDAARTGRLQPGGTILDASSGNTGIAYAMIAAQLGYRLVLCLPKNANRERQQLLAAYGATVEFTSPLEGSDGAIRRARELAQEHPDWVYLDQYNNDANWRAHYGSTGPELLAQTDGELTHFVSSLGTSGTFMGVTRFLKEAAPHVVCAAVQPDSPFHGLEGLKFMETSIVPGIYDGTIADVHVGAPTEAAYELLRTLSAAGFLVGPSCAAAVWGAVQLAQGLDAGTLACILPDSGERYLSEPHLWAPIATLETSA